MALKENYKDDILDVSVNTKRKYRMTENADGTISLDDETVYTQEGDSFGASDINAITEAVNNNSGMPVGTIATFDGTTLPSGFEPYQTEEQRAIAQINDNLNGFKFYPTGTGIVGLIADDSPYKDANGKYVIWGTPTANQLVADNPNTYKSVPSTEDLRGEVGADTAIPFNNTKIFDLLPETITIQGYANQTNQETVYGLGIPTMGVYKTCTFKCTAGRVGTNTSYFKKYCLNNGVIEPTTIYIANGSAPTIDISDAIYIDVVATDYNTARAYNYIFTLSK